MSFPRLWVFLAIALPIVASLMAALPSTDLTYHLRAGGEIIDGGRLPTVNTWTFTAAGAPWFDQQWGAQVLLAGVYRATGWTGLVLLRAGLVGLTFALVFVGCQRQGVGLRRAAWITLGSFLVAAVALALRPQLLGMALFALAVVIVVERHRHPRALSAMPLLVIVWANVHGSFFLGPVILGLAWLADVADRRVGHRRTLVVGAFTATAALVNPYGFEVWRYAAGLATNPQVTQRITEWQPTTVRDVTGILFFGSALVVAFLARRGRATPWPTLVWLAVFFVIGAYAVRGVAWWSIGAAAAVASLVPLRPSGLPDRQTPPTIHRLNLVVAAAVALAGVALLPFWRPIDPGLGAPVGVVSYAPSGITAELRRIAGPSDRLLNPQPWGSWFEFALPAVPIAIDSRIELFPVTVWDDYDTIASGRDGWQAVLERLAPTVVVTEGAARTDLGERLVQAGWMEVHADADGRILVPALVESDP